MNSSELLDKFRKEVSDTELPPLWSDEEIFEYINDAQEMFCRSTTGISDARTDDVVRLDIVPGTDWYTTHKAILHIREVVRNDTGEPVELLTAEQARTRRLRFAASVQGPLSALVAGMDDHALRAYPMPDETVTVSLLVYRLPLVAITDVGDQVLEIDSQHHIALLLWMKYRAYGKQDAETFDKRKSEDFRDRFLAYCAMAKLEQERARRALSSVAYGGI